LGRVRREGIRYLWTLDQLIVSQYPELAISHHHMGSDFSSKGKNY
jgi:hypothetical protein